jgi:formylglycine-generating enzyme required for sulfatase activity
MKNYKNVLFRIRESLSNALSYFLSRAERSAQNPVSIQRNFVVSFKYLQKKILFIFLLMLLCYSAAFANNISVSTVSLTGRDAVNHFIMVKFDIAWEDSWRTSSGPNNWDAAWVFVKYKVRGNYVSSAGATSSGTTITVGSTTGLRVGMPVSKTGGTGAFAAGTVVTAITDATHFTVSVVPTTPLSGVANIITGSAIWEHANINTTGLTPISGRTITPATDGTGAFIYRDADGTGTNSFTNTQLRWEYGVNGVADGASLDIEVFAIEMVYVPSGNFSVGIAGTQTGAFYNYPTTTNPYQISSEVAITVGTAANNLYYPIYQVSWPGDELGPIPDAFPKGYNAFYCMKYEIMQQQYVDFLNSLTRKQQTTRVYSNIATGFTSVTNRYVMSNASVLTYRNGIRCDATIDVTAPVTFYCDLNGNGIGNEADDGQDVAMNYLSWPDLAAYLDWSGLRPMTELEFEKSCRGTLAPVLNEYAWGTTGIAGSVYTLNTSGTNNEVVATNYSTTVGNAADYTTIPYNIVGNIGGPMRVGIFAGTSGNTGRVTAGATYYGIMEMSGNMFEKPITVGNPEGRSFTGTHGNGLLDATGNADATSWPGTNGIGAGKRGGSWFYNVIYLRVSDRESAAEVWTGRLQHDGGRGVRTAPVFTPVIGQSYGGGVIFYIDGTGQHGLIAATSDQSNGAAWGCSGTLITGADGTAIGTGNQNTIDIMAGCSTAGIAARLCGDLVLGGYSDWYLPSKDELNQMYLQKTVIGGFAAAGYYWSSTEAFSGSAWAYLFSDGSVNNWDKISPMYIRAIRSF